MSIISGNMVGGNPAEKTYIVVDENGNEFTAVSVENKTVFTATDNDVREGLVYASDGGVSVGTKNIPAYRTTKRNHLVLPGENYSIPLEEYDQYDYTQLQCAIAKYNTSPNDSVSVNKVVLNDNVYEVNSSIALSIVSKNIDTKSIDLNITNDTDDTFIIYIFTYREEI